MVGWDYKPVMPPAQRLGELEAFLARVPGHNALSLEVHFAESLADPDTAWAGVPRSVDHWTDCLVAATDLLASDKLKGQLMAVGRVGAMLMLGAEIALTHATRELQASQANARPNPGFGEIRKHSNAAAAGIMASLDTERYDAQRARLDTAIDRYEDALSAAV